MPRQRRPAEDRRELEDRTLQSHHPHSERAGQGVRGADSGETMNDTILALQQFYFAQMLDELKAFQTADRLIELFQEGLLPIEDHAPLDEWRSARTLLTGAERRGAYARAFGVPGGEDAGAPNRDDLWLRLL